MITTKEFKTLHGLSDSSFNRLTNRIKADCPGQDLTRRVNSRDWEILDVSLFERYLTPQKVEASEVVEATLEPDPIPCASIQVMSSDRATALDDLLGTFQAMEVYKPAQINLNGSQDEIADLLTVYASKIQEKKADIEDRKAALSDREAKLGKARKALSVMGSVEAGIESEASEINDKAKDLGADETDVKKQLAAILASLS